MISCLTSLKTITVSGRSEFDQISRYFVPKVLRRRNFCLWKVMSVKTTTCDKGLFEIVLNDEEAQENTRYLAFKGKFGTAFSGFIRQVPSNERVAEYRTFITTCDFEE